MQQSIEGLGINLIENDSFKDGKASVEDVLPYELKEKEYQLIGDFVVLPTPLEESFHEESEFFPNTDLENRKVSFLVAGVNEETKQIEEVLVVFEQIKTNNVIFSDPRPLEDWMSLLEDDDERSKKNSIFEVKKGHPTIGYGKWIIGTREKYKISDVGISNPRPMYLEKNITQERYEKILKVNEAKKAA